MVLSALRGRFRVRVRAVSERGEPLALREPGVTEQMLEAEKLVNPSSQ